jgi:hypothetical protein
MYEKLTEVNEKVSPPSPLPNRKCHDAAKIAVFQTPLLLAEVTHEMGAAFIHFCHHIEKEGLDIIEQ